MMYAKIFTCDISDGPGVRLGLYTQGCSHHCEGCFNPETWEPDGGKEWTNETNDMIISMLKKDRYMGISILGGDPFFWYNKNPLMDKKDDMLLDLVTRIRKTFGTEKSIWIWTGYTWEDIISLPDKRSIENIQFNTKCMAVLSHTDVLIDGKYEKDNCKNCKLYRGSNNQRVIDVQKTLSSKKVTLYIK